jgi:isopentenyl phosphate kinase
MKIFQQFPKKLDSVELIDISTSELWFIKEQYENEMIPVMYGPIELRDAEYTFYLLGNGDQIYGATMGNTVIVKLCKVTTKKALQMIALYDHAN